MLDLRSYDRPRYMSRLVVSNPTREASDWGKPSFGEEHIRLVAEYETLDFGDDECRRLSFIPPWMPKQRLSENVEIRGKKRSSKRIGFLKGRISVPNDFDTLGQAEIEAMFEG